MARERITSLRLSVDMPPLISQAPLHISQPSVGLEHLSIDIAEEDDEDEETRTLSDPSPIYRKVIDEYDVAMGKFMDQISMISTQAHLLQAQLETPGGIEGDGRDRRIILNLIESQLIRLTALQHSRPTTHDTSMPSERSMRMEQISGLKLRFSDMLVRLRELAGNERENLRQRIEPQLQVLEPEVRLSELYRLGPSEASKTLSRAVRSSRRYPEARQAALSVETQLARLRTIEDELKESDCLMHQLMESAEEEDELSTVADHKKLESKELINSERIIEHKPNVFSKAARICGITRFVLLGLVIPLLLIGGILLAILLVRRHHPNIPSRPAN